MWLARPIGSAPYLAHQLSQLLLVKVWKRVVHTLGEEDRIVDHRRPLYCAMHRLRKTLPQMPHVRSQMLVPVPAVETSS